LLNVDRAMRAEIIADLRSLLGPDRAIGGSLLPPVAFFAANAALGLEWAAGCRARVRGRRGSLPGDQRAPTARRGAPTPFALQRGF
jgi:hypothetical protein